MPITNPKETKNKILSILRLKGPSLPIHIASQTNLSSIFAGAFLSELANEDSIKISNLKVGGSPLYYIKGQENMLDPFYKFLPEKEREAFLSLKQNRILEDKKQEPAIRVALRSIKDFAVPFKNDEDIFWRFHSTTEQEVRDILEPKIEKVKEEKAEKQEGKEEANEEKISDKNQKAIEKTVEKESEIEKQENEEKNEQKSAVITAPKKEKPLDIGIKTTKKAEKPKTLKKTNSLEKFENPLILKEEIKIEKPKPPFVTAAIEKISRKFKIIEEKYYKPREYSCIVQVNSQLGPINFLAFAVDKKKLSETDLRKMLSESQKIPLPALILHDGELSKKAVDYSKAYFSVLKIERI